MNGGIGAAAAPDPGRITPTCVIACLLGFSLRNETVPRDLVAGDVGLNRAGGLRGRDRLEQLLGRQLILGQAADLRGDALRQDPGHPCA